MSMLSRIDNISGNPKFRESWHGFNIALFIFLILLPSMFIIFCLFTDYKNIIHDIKSVFPMKEIIN